MIDPYHIALRLIIAALLGSLVGLERERLDWAAGLRDHMLVCIGAALFMIVSSYGFADVLTSPSVVLDPSRIAAQVVSGIGFLGAGTILVRGEIIKGLTTAASLWATAAVGLAAGGGLYAAACITTALLLTILAGIKPLEKRLFPGRKPHEITLYTRSGTFTMTALEGCLRSMNAALLHVTIRHTKEPGIDQVDIVLRKHKDTDVTSILDALRLIDGVTQITHRRI